MIPLPSCQCNPPYVVKGANFWLEHGIYFVVHPVLGWVSPSYEPISLQGIAEKNIRELGRGSISQPTKIPISTHTVISGTPRMDSRVHKVLHNEILRVCEHKPRIGRVSSMEQNGNNQSMNHSCWIVVFFCSSYRRAASTCCRIHSNKKRGGVSARTKKNHHNNVAKFLHVGGHVHQITMTLKNHKCSVLVPTSWLHARFGIQLTKRYRKNL